MNLIFLKSSLNNFCFYLEHCVYHNGPRSGFKFLLDIGGFSFRHALKVKISSVRKIMRIIEDGCPFEIKSVHFLNTVSFLNLILSNSYLYLELLLTFLFYRGHETHNKIRYPKSRMLSFIWNGYGKVLQ